MQQPLKKCRWVVDREANSERGKHGPVLVKVLFKVRTAHAHFMQNKRSMSGD